MIARCVSGARDARYAWIAAVVRPTEPTSIPRSKRAFHALSSSEPRSARAGPVRSAEAIARVMQAAIAAARLVVDLRSWVMGFLRCVGHRRMPGLHTI